MRGNNAQNMFNEADGRIWLGFDNSIAQPDPNKYGASDGVFNGYLLRATFLRDTIDAGYLKTFFRHFNEKDELSHSHSVHFLSPPFPSISLEWLMCCQVSRAFTHCKALQIKEKLSLGTWNPWNEPTRCIGSIELHSRIRLLSSTEVGLQIDWVQCPIIEFLVPCFLVLSNGIRC